MYGLILVFVVFGVDGSVNSSRQITVYPSKEACEQAKPGIIGYEQGVEAGKGEPDKVGGWCLPLHPVGTTGS